MTELSDICLDPIGQADFQIKAVEDRLDDMREKANDLIIVDEMIGGYAEIMGEMYCRDKCEKRYGCKEGVKIMDQYDLSKSPNPR